MSYYEIELTLNQRKLAMWLVENSDIARRGDGTDGTDVQQYAGIVGQIALADELNEPRPTKQSLAKFDGGVDFTHGGQNIDLKVQPHNYPFQDYFVQNIYASQVENPDYKTDVYLFAHINTKKKIMEVIGWIRKCDLIRRPIGVSFLHKGERRRRNNGTIFIAHGDMYEISTSALQKFTNPADFSFQMEELSRIL